MHAHSDAHGHRRTRMLHLDLADLVILRRGHPATRTSRELSREYEAALLHVHGQSVEYLRGSHAGGLSSEDFEDIFHGALLDMIPAIWAQDIPLEDVQAEFQTALERHKKREQRYHLRIRLDATLEASLPASIELQHDIEHAVALMDDVHQFMSEALSRVADDLQHDLLVWDFGLDFSIDFRHGVPGVEPASALYAALSRARINFWCILDQLFRLAEQEGTHDPLILKEAREVLGHTRHLKRALAASRDMEDPPAPVDR